MPKRTMRYYFAIFYPIKEGGYAVEFPDIPEAFTSGQTLAEGMRLAMDVLGIAVEEYAKARRNLPEPSDLNRVKAVAAREMAAGKGLDASREPFIQLFEAPAIDMTPVKISVSFTRSVLDAIDAKARRRGMTRSGFLAALAMQA